jgi:pimeloyl-ACP methyl ester carboxylesterase
MRGCMEPVFRHRHGYKRIYFDLPGHGRTQASDSLENSDQMLELVIDFIRETVGGGEFLVAGESYGGYLARGLILYMPERIDARSDMSRDRAGALRRELPPQTAMVKTRSCWQPLSRSSGRILSSWLQSGPENGSASTGK